MRTRTWMLTLILTTMLTTGCAQRTIWEAARNGNLNNVKKELEKDPTLVNKPHYDVIEGDFDNRWTPLHYAVEHRHADIVKYLLDHGADPLQPAHGNYTPYHAARDDRKMERIVREAITKSGRPLP